nr:UTRA domain-containing protein [Morganella morganii]
MRGKKPDTLWVNKRVVKCPEEGAQQLAAEAGSDVFLLKRIRYVDEEAVSVYYTPQKLISIRKKNIQPVRSMYEMYTDSRKHVSCIPPRGGSEVLQTGDGSYHVVY